MSTKNIGHLRGHLFNQLEMLCDLDKKVDLERSRVVCEVSKQIIDTARVEIQFAAVMKGSVTLPFIEDQDGAGERPYTPPPAAPALSGDDDDDVLPGMTGEQRMQSALHSGPAPDHPWRGLGSRVVQHRIKQ
ncbi:hypothetical protein [Delftia tsuruhatensis]|uniref:Uncharacterized protein n=1 Tax=Delftia tsuruhatensis TaxID=180282 RepID=A0ABN4SDM3_9BURK|nr:hypothetical protein [Delftia tsuruhatensis]AOV00523.1 hypothetical protein BI380_03705 [Delftia tsuruhatensis]